MEKKPTNHPQEIFLPNKKNHLWFCSNCQFDPMTLQHVKSILNCASQKVMEKYGLYWGTLQAWIAMSLMNDIVSLHQLSIDLNTLPPSLRVEDDKPHQNFFFLIRFYMWSNFQFVTTHLWSYNNVSNCLNH